MNLKFRDIIQKVQSWFPQAQARIEAQAAELEARFDEKDFISLSPEEMAEYKKKIQSLSFPKVHKDAIKEKLNEGIQSWQKNENTGNNLWILFSPPESIKEIIKETIEQINDEALPPKYFFLETRPDEPSILKNKLQSQLNASGNDRESHSKPLVIIPDLSLYFLRCIEGLDAVEYLFDLILKDQSRFWVIGCNQWAWEYFDCIYQLNTCFQTTFYLPTLDAIELKQWLAPIYENLDLEFDEEKDESDNQSEQWHDQDNNWVSQKEKRYFDRLAKISEGLSQAAAHLWLDSLRYIQQSEQADSEEIEVKENKNGKKLILKRVTLPKLPDLKKDERYLLSAIGLHGEISLSALALSLDEREFTVRIKVQRLLKLGVICHQHKQLKLSPDYYSRLKRDLTYNHILVGEEN